MIGADTSSFIAFLQGEEKSDVKLIEDALMEKRLILPPVVLSEILSDPLLPAETAKYIAELPVIELTDGYWQRAGKSRAKLRAKKLKARLADTLIAQSCIDHSIPLITRDGDFRHFVELCGLRVVV